MTLQAKSGSNPGQGDTQGTKTGMGIDVSGKSLSRPGQGDIVAPKIGMGVEAAQKSTSNPGPGDVKEPKTGMGIEISQAHALLIGVGACKYTEWSLPATANDVEKLAAALAEPGLCGYAQENIVTLTNQQATRSGILSALDDLATKSQHNPAATFFIYYSGHGWRNESDGRYFLIPHEFLPHNIPASGVAAEDFIAGLRLIESDRVVVMVDTCHASGMAEAKDLVAQAPSPKGFAVDSAEEALAVGSGRAVFLSCKKDQKSWLMKDARLSIFTHHLLEGLRHAGRGEYKGTATVTISDLMSYLYSKVPATARESGKEQTPVVKFDEAEDFAVALSRGGKGLEAPLPAEMQQPKVPRTQVNVHKVEAGENAFVIGEIGSLHLGDRTVNK